MTSSTGQSELFDELDEFGRAGILAAAMAHRWGGGDDLSRICSDALFPPGKLFRPHLLVEAGLAVGGTLEHLVPAAVGTEFGHVASLVHDDIIDRDQLRRGRPSVWANYGVDTAILSGDALFFSLFASLAECYTAGADATRVVRALAVIAEVGVDLCRGQLLEAKVTADLHCGRDRYFQVIRLKTAALFGGSAACGAILGGGSAWQVEAVQRYADELGTAFQIRDDLLPYISDTRRLGKSSASDAANKRVTLPVLVAYERGDAAARAEIERIFTTDRPGAFDHRILQTLVTDTGAAAEVMAVADTHVRNSLARLRTLAKTSSRDRLERYAELASVRMA